MTAVPHKVWPLSVRLMDLPAYAYGGIAVEKHTQNEAGAVTISPGTPGSIYLAQDRSGPKDWSPHGTVPKEWTFIMRIPPHQAVRLLFTYVNIEGHQRLIEQTIQTPKGIEALYFVPL